jgi:DNA repair protein RecO (recombination protein O)
MRQREPAICIRATDYSETSQVVSFLTRGAGVVRLLAKGSKRAKSATGGAIDLLSEGELLFIPARGGLGTLVEFSETVSRSPLRAGIDRLNTALYMVELSGELLAESDPHPEVFDLLHNSLDRLGQDDAPLAAVLAYFQWRLLRRVGLLGEMKDCVSCGRAAAGTAGGAAAGGRGRGSGEVYFSSIQGGILCGDCEHLAAEKRRLDGSALAGIAALTAAEAGAKVALPDKQAAAVNRLLAYHASQQLGKPLKMARHAITSNPK